jgi:RsiW-degrading membrane proteinase PrsW (M82 family)
MLFAFAHLPTAYMALPGSTSYLVSLFGFVFQVGVCEELCKFLPVIGYILWKRSKADPMTIVLVGVFSGLGFAAFENVMKSSQAILSTLNVRNVTEAAIQVHGGIIQAMTRSLSCVFGHAVYSGILAYFLATAFVSGRRWGALLLVGVLVAATIHGFYDWLCGVQLMFSAIWTGVAFMLFYGYIAKLRGTIAAA